MEDRIKNVMSAVFEISVEQITEDSSPDTIESWDSLKHMNLVIALEDEFNISIPDSEVANILTFTLIVYVVKEAINLSSVGN